MRYRLIATLICLASSSHAADIDIDIDRCVQEALQTANDQTTIGELRQDCRPANAAADTAPTDSAMQKRLREEIESTTELFRITAYRPNYVLLATYNSSPNEEDFNAVYPDAEYDDVEAKFQISFKALMWDEILGRKSSLWGAYSQQSWWQVYNTDASAPFRETNYEPEIFVRWENDGEIAGFRNSLLSLGFNHESNGRGEELSRSWNRIIGSAVFDRGNLALVGRAWYRIPEDDESDDNPDIMSYAGYGDLLGVYRWHGQIFEVGFSNNLRSENHGWLQLGWTFPIGGRFKGYVQYYNGYAESLIDYDDSTNRIGFGVLLNDWL